MASADRFVQYGRPRDGLTDPGHGADARNDDGIVGTLTLVLVPLPTGLRAHIEAVVDGAARGQGVGEVLTLEAIRLARAAGSRTVDLSSRPSRVAANRLYQKLGCRLRESQIYRFG